MLRVTVGHRADDGLRLAGGMVDPGVGSGAIGQPFQAGFLVTGGAYGCQLNRLPMASSDCFRARVCPMLLQNPVIWGG